MMLSSLLLADWALVRPVTVPVHVIVPSSLSARGLTVRELEWLLEVVL